MNARFLLFAMVFFALFSLSFTGEKKPAAMPENHLRILEDYIPDNYYIPDSFFESYNLKFTKKNVHMRVWDNPDKKGFYRTLNDIRYRFQDAKTAGEQFDKNLESNSEAGRELHPGIKIPGTTHLHIFKESKAMDDRLKTFGVRDTRFYYYLFLVDNVYVKIFVIVDKSIGVREAAVFAEKAASSVQAALEK